MPPTCLGLCITIQHKYGHPSLGDSLNKLGTRNLENKAVGTQGVDLELNDNIYSFLQWIADNVDHDNETHPGNNTVHMLGITGTVTPGVRTYHY